VYWRISEVLILESTSVKSMPEGMATFVPGVRMVSTDEARDFMIEEDSPAETWNIRARTAIWVGSARGC
jgi:hypothetical protein